MSALAAHGFRRFFFINGHGGNTATVKAAFAELHAIRWQACAPALKLGLSNWWDAPGVAALSNQFYGEADGFHATASEIAITQHLFPEYTKEFKLDPPLAPNGSFQDAIDFRKRFPDGRIGSNPGLSTAEHGAEIFRAAISGLAEIYRAFANLE